MKHKNMKKIPIELPTEAATKDFTASGYNSENSWEPSPSTPYMSSLAVIALPRHFDYLQENYPPFMGSKETAKKQKQQITAALWKEMFTDIAVNLSEKLIPDLDKENMTAACKTIIDSVPFENRMFDSGQQNRTIYLIQGYNPQQQECTGIGFANIEFRLMAMDYTASSGEYIDATLDVIIRTSLYADVDKLQAEVTFLKEHF